MIDPHRQDGVLSAARRPVTGSSHEVNAPVGPSTRPRKAEPTARTIIGTVMSLPDSCGCTSSVQRFLPWKVMKNRRDM